MSGIVRPLLRYYETVGLPGNVHVGIVASHRLRPIPLQREGCFRDLPAVDGRPNDTSEGRFKRYQLKTKGLLLSRNVFLTQETCSRGRNGLSTGHGQDVIYQAVTR